MGWKRLTALAIAGLLLMTATVINAARTSQAPSTPRASAQDHRICLPFVVDYYPPSLPPPPIYHLYADSDDLAWLAEDPCR